ncbi:uncharacterized protein LOC125939847 [Dermacentor silvarum]|uniref:uncharacterized protein LOC125939847 n=1 Tax=Dermacentor silvarum TaxID=543639 RepID=UPI0021013F18|nr:uncharacterized protein LOC125939847 [Dermacentor silvarum]
MRVGHQSNAQRRIRVLPGIQVLRNDRCCLKLLLADELATVAATFTTEYAEHLTEWKYLLTSLMTVHRCIHTLCLNISAVAPSSGRFYRAFRLRGGTAEIDVGSSLDLTEGIRHLAVFPLTDRRFGSSSHEPNSNLAWILDAIRDMPYLRHLKIYMANAVPERCTLQELSLTQPRCGSTELRRQIYDVDAPYVPMLFCAGGDKRTVSTAIAADRTIIPRLLASRELTSSASLLTPYPLTVTRYPSPDDCDFVASLIIRRRGDQ